MFSRSNLSNVTTGPFSVITGSSANSYGDGSSKTNHEKTVYFNASMYYDKSDSYSSILYGQSEVVTPKSIAVHFIIKY